MYTMMALRAHQRGGPERLIFEAAPVPTPAPDEVLVRVEAGAITFAELSWDESWTTRDGKDRTPMIPSHEVAGVVAALGPGVTDLRLGDEVYGLVDFDRNGAAAQYVSVPAADLAHRPKTVPAAEAAALPLAALTAWQALVDHAAVVPGETVLVHGGAGGVGVYAVQLAHLLGATVIATDLPANARFVTALGADRFIDVSAEAFDQTISAVDVVLDTVGGTTLDRSYGVLRKGGRLITLGAPPPAGKADEYGVTVTFFVVRPNRSDLERIASYVDSKELRPVVTRTFPLSEGRAAFESGNLPRKPGKTVLVVS